MKETSEHECIECKKQLYKKVVYPDFSDWGDDVVFCCKKHAMRGIKMNLEYSEEDII